MNIIQINSLVFGKIAGRVISAIYIWYFLTLTSINIRDGSDFINQNLMTKTPLVVLMAILVFACALAVRHGVAIVTKYSSLISITITVIVILSIVFLKGLIKFDNYFPIFDFPAMKYVQSINIIMAIPLADVFIFLMFMPSFEFKKSEIKKATFIGFFIGSLFLLLTSLRDIGVLGDSIQLFKLPSFEVYRLIGLSEYRVDILYAIELTILRYFKVSLLYYVTVLAIAQLFNLKEFKPIVYITGILAVAYAITLYSSSLENFASKSQTEPFIMLFGELVLPLITLVIAKARKLPQKAGGEPG